MSKKSRCLSLLAVLFSVLIGAGCRKSSPVVLNELRDEVRRTNGRPSKSSDLQDIWDRSTRSNEYLVTVKYRQDYSRSQFHPDEYVSRIAVRPDKRESLRVILNDLPEARLLCAQGCSVLGIYVYAIDSHSYDQELLRIERQIKQPISLICRGTSGGSLDWWKANSSYQQCITVSYQFESYEKAVSPPFDWEFFRIDQITVEELRPSELLQPHPDDHMQMDSLGDWKPSTL